MEVDNKLSLFAEGFRSLRELPYTWSTSLIRQLIELYATRPWHRDSQAMSAAREAGHPPALPRRFNGSTVVVRSRPGDGVR